ncbi:hypothetical protein [Actinotalea sp. JY-7876]|uniref:hypothetical protein n=1 Tax=Actinotalea sp. JY-7876 TaxID=2758442 RepID=UPI0015F4EDCF|nr:hypothetical protein [Actinotalea sp. JY-7876]
MRIDPMSAPADQEFLEEFGVTPEPIDEYGGRLLRFNNEADERLDLSFDLTDQSVAYRWWSCCPSRSIPASWSATVCCAAAPRRPVCRPGRPRRVSAAPRTLR